MKYPCIFIVLIIIFMVPDTAAQGNDLSDQTDHLFQKWDREDSPGCALAVIRDGAIIYQKGYGMADLEHDVPIAPETVFYIGSNSKQFVSFCILLLQEQGKLDLNDDIHEYIPDFPDYEVPITIRHLIHHTSGIRDYLNLFMHAGRNYLDHISGEEAYDMICRQKALNFPPGEEHLYSNSCYFLLWQIIEKASGKSLREFGEEKIFQPLGMRNTSFHDDNTRLVKNRAFSYFPKDSTTFGNLIMRFDLVGSGGLYTTVEDLFLWDQNFYSNKLGKGDQGLITMMHENGKLNNGNEIDYAFALINGKYRGARTVKHGGALAGYRSQILRFPDLRFSVIILANVSDFAPDALAYEVADLYLGKELDPQKAGTKTDISSDRGGQDIDPVVFDKYIGRYELAPNYILNVFREQGRMLVQLTGQPAVEIFPESEKRFFLKIVDAQIEFGLNEDGSVKGMVLFQNGQAVPGIRMDNLKLTEEMKSEFVGDYYSEELDATYRIFLDDEKLMLRVGYFPVVHLMPSREDVFEGGFTYKFFRDGDGAVTGFTLDAGRVRNMRFQKMGPGPDHGVAASLSSCEMISE